MEESKEDQSWFEIRVQGKLPERRANHCAWVWLNNGQEYMYIHGGRDLKEGTICTLWRINLTNIQQLQQGINKPVGWEQVQTSAKNDIGKISHHRCAMISANEVVFFGGNKAEGNNTTCHVLNLLKNEWSTVSLTSKELPAEQLSRDDHAICTTKSGNFVCFGGYQQGTRDAELFEFENTGSGIGVEAIGGHGPSARAGASLVAHEDMLVMFGGQEDDNRKMKDVWSFNMTDKKWSQIEIAEGQYCPMERSGHTAVVHGNKMFIFGGIFELTHELNDLCSFDFETCQFRHIGDDDVEHQRDDIGDQSHKPEQTPGLSRKKTFAATASINRTKTKTMGSPTRQTMKKQELNETDGGNREGQLSSPTSVSMKNTFIIKNADESFEINSKLIPKLKGQRTLAQESAPKVTSFVEASRPTPRDGHSAVVDSAGNMYVFGGDRHHMPFNDLYMIKLE